MSCGKNAIIGSVAFMYALMMCELTFPYLPHAWFESQRLVNEGLFGLQWHGAFGTSKAKLYSAMSIWIKRLSGTNSRSLHGLGLSYLVCVLISSIHLSNGT